MTDAPTLDIAELRRLADAATPGPWAPSVGGYQVLTNDDWNTVCVFHEGSGERWRDHRRAHWREGPPSASNTANADFTAAARTAVPALLDAYERVCKERDETQEEARQAWFARDASHATATAFRQERDEVSAENTKLRAALAVSKDPCLYCQLPSDEIAKCESGFPGCARADDLCGCPEFGAMMQLSDARAQAERDAETIKRFREALEQADQAFEATYVEGLPDAITQAQTLIYGAGSLVGLVQRRLLPARDYIIAALASAPDAGEQQEKRDER